jgi:hypothetical protein
MYRRKNKHHTISLMFCFCLLCYLALITYFQLGYILLGINISQTRYMALVIYYVGMIVTHLFLSQRISKAFCLCIEKKLRNIKLYYFIIH